MVSLVWWIREYNGTSKASSGARLPTVPWGSLTIFFATRLGWLCLQLLFSHWFKDALPRKPNVWFWVAWGTPRILFQWITCWRWWLGVSCICRWCSSMWTFTPFGLWFLLRAQLQSICWSNPQWQRETWFSFWPWEMAQVYSFPTWWKANAKWCCEAL